MSRKQRRQAARAARKAEQALPAWAPPGENREPKPPGSAPAATPHLTRKQLAFATAWAEAEPDDNLYEIAQRAGYSESVSASGKIAELCRNPEVVKLRDRRLAEMRSVSGVTPEDALVNLQRLAADEKTPAKDRVAALKAILAWYARDKGQQAGPRAPAAGQPERGRGLTSEMISDMEVGLLGVPLDAPFDDEEAAP